MTWLIFGFILARCFDRACKALQARKAYSRGFRDGAEAGVINTMSACKKLDIQNMPGSEIHFVISIPPERK